MASKSHFSYKEIANFHPDKATFPDNPLQELSGAYLRLSYYSSNNFPGSDTSCITAGAMMNLKFH
jgi:hypothetical protein